jgi:hypothetical protein
MRSINFGVQCLPNKGIEMDFEKQALFKTTHAWR